MIIKTQDGRMVEVRRDSFTHTIVEGQGVVLCFIEAISHDGNPVDVMSKSLNDTPRNRGKLHMWAIDLLCELNTSGPRV